jgi:hypothetical protein
MCCPVEKGTCHLASLTVFHRNFYGELKVKIFSKDAENSYYS